MVIFPKGIGFSTVQTIERFLKYYAHAADFLAHRDKNKIIKEGQTVPLDFHILSTIIKLKVSCNYQKKAAFMLMLEQLNLDETEASSVSLEKLLHAYCYGLFFSQQQLPTIDQKGMFKKYLIATTRKVAKTKGINLHKAVDVSCVLPETGMCAYSLAMNYQT